MGPPPAPFPLLPLPPPLPSLPIGAHPLPDDRARPNEPLRAKLAPVKRPLEADARYETRPKPLGRCLPTPAATPPTVWLENTVGRGVGRKEAPGETADGGAGGGATRPGTIPIAGVE